MTEQLPELHTPSRPLGFTRNQEKSLDWKTCKMVHAMVCGISEPVDDRAIGPIPAGVPLKLEQAARIAGMSLKRARRLWQEPGFQETFRKSVEIYKASLEPGNLAQRGKRTKIPSCAIGAMAAQCHGLLLVSTANLMNPETGSRLGGRIEAVLDWARVRGYRQGESPARWKGNLDQLLPAKGKISVVKHHEAPPSKSATIGPLSRKRESARQTSFAVRAPWQTACR